MCPCLRRVSWKCCGGYAVLKNGWKPLAHTETPKTFFWFQSTMSYCRDWVFELKFTFQGVDVPYRIFDCMASVIKINIRTIFGVIGWLTQVTRINQSLNNKRGRYRLCQINDSITRTYILFWTHNILFIIQVWMITMRSI